MYQDHLSEATRFLNEAEMKLQEIMLNLMMTGELSDWNLSSPIDEVIKVDNSLFEASEDANVQILLNLCSQIRVVSKNLSKNQ